jgi:hypothetical protein
MPPISLCSIERALLERVQYDQAQFRVKALSASRPDRKKTLRRASDASPRWQGSSEPHGFRALGLKRLQPSNPRAEVRLLPGPSPAPFEGGS